MAAKQLFAASWRVDVVLLCVQGIQTGVLFFSRQTGVFFFSCLFQMRTQHIIFLEITMKRAHCRSRVFFCFFLFFPIPNRISYLLHGVQGMQRPTEDLRDCLCHQLLMLALPGDGYPDFLITSGNVFYNFQSSKVCSVERQSEREKQTKSLPLQDQMWAVALQWLSSSSISFPSLVKTP